MDILDGIEAKVTAAMNVDFSDLDRIYEVEEVYSALRQMYPNKAPGPDEMPPIFFQKYWHIIGGKITAAVLEVLNTGHFPSDLNKTCLVLILKTDSPTLVSDFRFISLCNVIYKLIAKVITNRLKAILPSIISDTQTAFVHGKLITDNVLVAYELVHYLKQKRKGKKGFMSLKLDMFKAYDWVEWDFLLSILLKLGFNSGLVSLIMKCVTSVSFSVLVNGNPIEPIFPTRGLRQGDPLSPYLFLICTEALVSLLKNAELDRSVKGVKICQMINKQKTAMIFSSNVPSSLRQTIMAMWGGTTVQQYGKYLGLPPIVGKAKTIAFGEIKSRVWRRLQSWKEKLLSQGGREILVKAVACSIPSFAMSCFKLPAKKAWRVLKQEDSSVHKLLKAKYFPKSSLFKAQKGNNPSFTWRGIWEARTLLMKGCQWRIGNGATTRIWHYTWIPSHQSLIMEENGTAGRDLSTRVTSLIDVDIGWWNVSRFRALFNPNIASDVLKILLSPVEHEDMLMWRHEKKDIILIMLNVQMPETCIRCGNQFGT
ncbi:uncharacterized protein LOC122278446 [Carya illinoinensis]|uniref:uncharacterized protein LOC122278446 n=1 Tax=Carya illinoinensis TaxID=32201 RepID=UPI001C71A90D|nr:uncharacterized protein LOC122278446 [Carya illinoinensis]